MRKNKWIFVLLAISFLTGCGEKVSPPFRNDSVIYPPSGLSALIITATTLELRWTDNSDNEDGFYVMRYEVGGDTNSAQWAAIETVTANTIVFYDSTAVIGESYSYRINAFNSATESEFSNTVTISFSIPDAPSGLNAEVLSDTRIALSWIDNSDNETNFLVCRQDTGVVVISGITATNTVSYVDTNLTGNTQYSYYVAATNSLGSSSSETIIATTLTTIRLAGSIQGPMTSFPVFLHIEGNYAYCSGFWGAYNSMKIIDISVPDQFSITGGYFILFQTDDLYVKGDYAYIAHDSGFVMVDVSTPSAPVQTNEYIKTPGRHLICVSDNYIFLASSGSFIDSLLIMDLPDSTGFSVLGRHAEPQNIQDICYEEEYIYLLTADALKIIDISNPSNPVVVGYYNPEYSTDDIHVCNGYVYLANDIGFIIINVADPLVPVIAGSYLLSGGCDRLFADSSYAYIYNNSDIFRAVDITVPALPQLSGRYDDSSIEELFATGNYIYICNNDSLQVLYLEAGDGN
ncbi:MAG: hypothetical protein JSW64_00500 [Candidatus Zixiibacteriota bacterium]|nr:MAG: hypothetical protein JSW64_00500 [candidate division Zixibacteria bacterium]